MQKNKLTKVYMGELNIKGFWWLSDNPDEKYAGVLTFDGKEKPLLELFGCFERLTLANRSRDVFTQDYVIHGCSLGGELISLLYCFISKHTSAAVEFCSFKAQFVLKGEHINSIDDACFVKSIMEFEYLRQWLRPRLVETNDGDDGYSIFCKRKIESCQRTIDISDDLRVSFRPNWLAHTEYETGITTVTEYTSAVLESKNPHSLHDYYKLQQILQQFMSLVFFTPQYYTKCVLSPENEEMEMCELFFLNEESKKPLRPSFLRYDTVNPVLDSFLRKWFEQAEDMYPIQNHLIRSMDSAKSIGNEDFLVIAQAIDGLAAKILGNNGSLASNARSMYDRLKGVEMLAKNRVNTQVLAAVRNHYAHMHKCKDDALMVYGDDQLKLRLQAKLLLVAMLLHFYGLDDKGINDCLNHSEFKAYRFINSK